MNQLLTIGATVQTDSSRTPVKVLDFLGGGGQGEVYRADLAGAEVALKWYFPHQATDEHREALQTIITMGQPNDKFLWPMDLAVAPNARGYGYIMPLRDPRFKGIIDLMKKRVDPSFRAIATTGMELAHSFLQLHAAGLCYRDISFGNVFFDPDVGSVLICDNDNVAVDNTAVTTVLGTPGFMAPEIVRREALPSTQTDLYSLAVLLFYLIVVAHPLDGFKEASIKCLDLPARERLYGREPVFIFHPTDESNRPVPGLHDNAIETWPILPTDLRELFTRAFTEGIDDPVNGRVRETEWRRAMVALRDSIFYCASCGAEAFYDGPKLHASGGDPGACWSCGKALRLPPRIRIDRNIVMLNYDTRIYPHHVDSARQYDFEEPVAEVTQHPRNPSLWGLKNLSSGIWSVTKSDGTLTEAEPGRSVPLAVGTTINFGTSEGEIRI